MKIKSKTASKPKDRGTAQQTRESGDPGMAPANDAIPREQLIAVAAYFRAEQRGFAPGNEMSDWLDAEAVVEHTLGSRAPASGISVTQSDAAGLRRDLRNAGRSQEVGPY